MIQQSLDLSRKPHIVIATPGRLLSHLQSTDTLKLNRLKFLVSAETDQTKLRYLLISLGI